ncbi:DUF257 family protein [Thermococcus camini]|uniref:KaiC-like domain-containing protein n=1 Tax=Thermococcus camini TaxID=2016373 RepID=A0A7G2D4J3_9EURY|nr:DUF257 family protein [Thermococcus camini]CAD5243186.1 conserved protein of unknown function [Thermococcus camini]
MSVPDGLMVNLWESLRMGEIVLMERTDSGDQYFGFYQVVSWGRGRGYKVVVIDILDSLHILKAKARLAGLDEGALDSVKVIKIGGTIETGEVVGWIRDISEPVILAKKFMEIYTRLLESEGPTLTAVVGLEKLFVASEFSPKNVQVILSAISKYVGDERRLSVQFLKANVIECTREPVVRLLEDLATTVIQISRKDRATEFKILKSVDPKLEGMTIKI